MTVAVKIGSSTIELQQGDISGQEVDGMILVETFVPKNIAMQLHDFVRPRLAVKVVDVLR